jgi:hypothetical protein
MFSCKTLFAAICLISVSVTSLAHASTWTIAKCSYTNDGSHYAYRTYYENHYNCYAVCPAEMFDALSLGYLPLSSCASMNSETWGTPAR